MAGNDHIYSAIEEAINSQTAFGDLLNAEEKQSLIDHGMVHSTSSGEVLCRQGENDRRVFIIVMGEVEISEGDGDEEVVLAHLKRGEVFGEISALFESPRISNVKSTKPGVMLIVPGEFFEKVITGRAELYSAILARYKTRLSETALRSVDIFRRMEHDDLLPLIESSSIAGIAAGGVILKEGEVGDHFYILIRGTARVSHMIDGREINLALMQPGDYFGEWSVLTGAPRAATVSAINRVDLLQISREVMLELVQQYPSIGERIDRVAHKRKQATNEFALTETSEQLDTVLKNIQEVIRQGMQD